MQAFLCTQRPRSVNARYTNKFQQQIRAAYNSYCGNPGIQAEPLYGIVYYFHNRPNQLDADNLSKPVWDALKDVIYQDDSLIQLRHSGIIDLRKTDMTFFDLSRIPDDVANDIIAFAGSEDHILYIEFGTLQLDMFLFGCE